MIARTLVVLGLIVLTAGFIFFAGNVIWLGTKEFFKVYGPKAKKPEEPASGETTALPTPEYTSTTH